MHMSVLGNKVPVSYLPLTCTQIIGFSIAMYTVRNKKTASNEVNQNSTIKVERKIEKVTIDIQTKPE